MYAVIETGGKQYRVEVGQLVDIELLPVESGQVVEFSNVLLIQEGQKVHVGQPHVAGAKVMGTAQQIVGGPKLVAYKYKKRKNERRKVGHRQKSLRVRVDAIQV